MSLPRLLSSIVCGVVLILAAAGISTPPSTVTVKVLSAQGGGSASEVWVAVVDLEEGWGRPVREAVLPAGSDSLRWELPPGNHQVVCVARGGGWRRLPPMELAPGDVVPVVCRLPRLGTAEITVVEADGGRPLEGVQVEAAFLALGEPSWPPGAIPFLRTTAAGHTGRDGVARVSLPAGSRGALVVRGEGLATTVVPPLAFRTDTVARRHIRVRAGGSLDVRVEAVSPGLLEGLEVVPEPTAVSGDPEREPDADREAGEILSRLRRAPLGQDGRIRWEGLVPGLYRVEGRWPERPDLGMEILGLAVVRPLAATVLDLPLGRVTVVGRLTGFDPELLELAGDPAALRLEAESWRGGEARVEVFQREPGGIGPEALEYRVNVPAGGFALLSLMFGAMDLVPVGSVDLRGFVGDQVRADFELPTGSARVRVLGPGGQGIQGAEVRLVDAATAASNLRGAFTDADGVASFPNLARGTWRVVARKEGVGVSTVARLAVNTGASELTLVLEPGETLTGRVLDPGGGPLRGARVFCAPRAVPTLMAGGITDGRGRFAIPDLPGGATVVVACPGQPGRDRHLAFARAEVDPGYGPGVDLVVEEGAVGGVLLLPPAELADFPLSPFLGWEIDGVEIPHRLVRRCVGFLAPQGPRAPGLLLGGFPRGRYRLTFFHVEGRTLGRTRPFDLEAGGAADAVVVELDLER